MSTLPIDTGLSPAFGGGGPAASGYGIGKPGAYQPYSTPGLTKGTLSTTLQNGNLDRAGAAENQYGRTAGAWNAPGQGENWAANNIQKFDSPLAVENWTSRNAGQYEAPGMGESFAGQVSNRYGAGNTPSYVSDQYNSIASSIPQDMSSYYDNARRKAAEQVNAQMAGRGMYSSSSAGDRISEAMTDLSAQEAKDNAQYGLQRGQLGLQAGQAASQDEQSWLQGLSGIANNAQSLGLQRLSGGLQATNAASDANLQRLSTAGNLANQAQAASQSRLTGGMNAANMAQNAQQGRLGFLVNSQMSLADRLAQQYMGATNNMFAADQAALNGALGVGQGLASDAQQQDYNKTQGLMNDTSWSQDVLKKGMDTVKGGSMMGMGGG